MNKLAYLFALWMSASALLAQKPIAIDPELITRHGPERGRLVIIGGNGSTEKIWDKIIEGAGGKDKARFVVVTNGQGDNSTDTINSKIVRQIAERIGGDKSRVKALHLKNISEANDEKNLKELKRATGIFFGGGRQWRISDVYLNTLAHQEFLNVLARGGVIAGSSAGASIQGSFLWRGDTENHHILVGDHTQGLGFLRNSVIDQHLLARNRQDDPVAFARLAPKLFVAGLDEATAIVVERDELEVVGKSCIVVYNNIDPDDSRPYIFLREGQKYDLGERKVIENEKKEKPVSKGNLTDR
jgi:cyanophycinase